MKRLLALAVVLTALPAFAGKDPRDRAEWNPPTRYDHPFRGKLTEVPLPPEQVFPTCKAVFKKHGQVLAAGAGRRGCADFNADRSRCTIYYIDRPLGLAMPKAVRRHELGHCNGWPNDHPE